MKELRESQRRFFELITAPGGVAGTAGDEPLHRWVRGGSHDIAADRLQRYADMYFFRLLDILKDDYLAVHALVGDKAFERLARDYLSAHPSTMPSVRDAGMHLPAFLKTYAPLCEPFPYVSDLALLERTRAEVFDREDAVPLAAADLGAIAPERWAELAFRPIPAARLLDLEWPVTLLWRPLVWDEGEVPQLSPGATCVLVWRKDFRVYHRTVSDEEAPRLRQLFAGASFAQMCEQLATTDDDVRAAATRAAQTLAGWVGEELLIFA